MENSPDYLELIRKLQESDEKLQNKNKNLIYKQSELEKQIKSICDSKHNLEMRISILESINIEDLKKEIYKIDSKVQSFESAHDDRKEKWQIAINFIVQLIWVAMAAWLLTKLGLQAPL